jgi:ABC-2 type transport system ATP-binding protein
VCGEKIGVGTKAMVSYLPDRFSFDKDARVQQQLDLFQDFYLDFDRSRAEEMLRTLKIDPSARFKTLSKGNQEKVQLVLAMSRRAKLYLLDEPIGGVDPAARDYILHTIIANYDPDATVLISTHLIADVERILDSFLFLKSGKILMQGNADEKRAEVGRSLDEYFREVFVCSES